MITTTNSKFLQDVFAYVDSITVSKKNIMLTEADEKTYRHARWTIHRALSFSPDLVETINLLNTMRDMPPRWDYEFLLNFVPVKIRRPKWFKKPAQSLYLETICEYYGYNETKAEEAMKILTVDQMATIEQKLKREDVWTFLEDGASK